MILHFLKRDFLTYKFNWVLLLAFMILVAPLIYFAKFDWPVLFFAFSIFAILPSQNLTGVSWRSQHVMSRNYLLSLPIERKKLFNIIILRFAVFYVPMMGLAFLFPYRIFDEMDMVGFNYILFEVICFFLIKWIMSFMIFAQIQVEKVSSRLTQRQRFIGWSKYLFMSLFELIIALGVLACFLYPNSRVHINHYILLFIAVALAEFRLYRARQNWLGLK